VILLNLISIIITTLLLIAYPNFLSINIIFLNKPIFNFTHFPIWYILIVITGILVINFLWKNLQQRIKGTYIDRWLKEIDRLVNEALEEKDLVKKVDYLLQLNKPQEALEIIQQLEKTHRHKIELFINKCFCFMIKGDFARAIQECKLTAQKFPDSFKPLLALSLIYWNQGMRTGKPQLLDKAIEESLKVLEKEPNEPEALANLGMFYLIKRKSKKALKYLKQSLASDPNCGAAHYVLGMYYQEKKKFFPALREFIEALKELPLLLDLHINFAWSLSYFSPLKSRAMLERVLMLNPKSSLVYNSLGVYQLDYYLKGKETFFSAIEKARDTFFKYSRLFPQDSYAILPVMFLDKLLNKKEEMSKFLQQFSSSKQNQQLYKILTNLINHKTFAGEIKKLFSLSLLWKLSTIAGIVILCAITFKVNPHLGKLILATCMIINASNTVYWANYYWRIYRSVILTCDLSGIYWFNLLPLPLMGLIIWLFCLLVYLEITNLWLWFALSFLLAEVIRHFIMVTTLAEVNLNFTLPQRLPYLLFLNPVTILLGIIISLINLPLLGKISLIILLSSIFAILTFQHKISFRFLLYPGIILTQLKGR